MVLTDLTISTCCKTGLGPSLHTCITFDPVEFHPDHLDFLGIQWKRQHIYHSRGKLSYAVFIQVTKYLEQ